MKALPTLMQPTYFRRGDTSANGTYWISIVHCHAGKQFCERWQSWHQTVCRRRLVMKRESKHGDDEWGAERELNETDAKEGNSANEDDRWKTFAQCTTKATIVEQKRDHRWNEEKKKRWLWWWQMNSIFYPNRVHLEFCFDGFFYRVGSSLHVSDPS